MVTSGLLLEQLDLPTRRTQKPKLGLRDLGVVQHQRVQLVHRQPLAGRLHDDQAAMVAQATAAALTVEERDQAQSLAKVSASLVRSSGRRILCPLSCRVPAAPGGGEMLGGAHPWMMEPVKSGFKIVYGDRDG